MDASDKITVITYPGVPNKCAICNRGSDGERKFVDFQLSVDYYGAIVICLDCFFPVAQVLGYHSEQDYEEVTQQLRNVHDFAQKVKEENELLNASLNSLFAVRPNLKPDYPMADENTDQDSGENEYLFEFDDSTEGIDDRETSESATERGSENFSQSELSL